MKLNLCCGPNMFPGWVNMDRADMDAAYLRHIREAGDVVHGWPESQRALAVHVQGGGELDFRIHDVRKGLPFDDNSVDAIYIGQAIEHFNRRTEAPALLRECLRVLKQGGAIRLTTPNLETLTSCFVRDDNYGGMGKWTHEQPEFYAAALPEDQLSYLLFGASGPDSTNENYEGHHHCYTPRSLGSLLKECGFSIYKEGTSLGVPAFAEVRDMGMSHSFAIEAIKP